MLFSERKYHGPSWVNLEKIKEPVNIKNIDDIKEYVNIKNIGWYRKKLLYLPAMQ